MNILIGFFTVILVLVCLFMIMIVLLQRPRAEGGLGAALGGGAAESAFGHETSTVLTKATIYCAIFFFIASLGLYLGHMHMRYSPVSAGPVLPEMHSVVGPEESAVLAPEQPDQGVQLEPGIDPQSPIPQP